MSCGAKSKTGAERREDETGEGDEGEVVGLERSCDENKNQGDDISSPFFIRSFYRIAYLAIYYLLKIITLSNLI